MYGLLPSKSAETYRRFWNAVTEERDLPQPTTIMTDFELASVQALRESFPDARITGCFFHLGQSLWRHVQNSGLRQSYIADEEVRIKIKSLVAAFEELVETFPDNLTPISNYFEDVYIGIADSHHFRPPCGTCMIVW
jgi:transposase-like protein